MSRSPKKLFPEATADLNNLFIEKEKKIQNKTYGFSLYHSAISWPITFTNF